MLDNNKKTKQYKNIILQLSDLKYDAKYIFSFEIDLIVLFLILRLPNEDKDDILIIYRATGG